MSAKIMEVKSVHVVCLSGNPPLCAVSAIGAVNTSGWKNGRLVPRVYAGGKPNDGILDFDFYADPPDGLARWVISPIKALLTLQELPDSIVGVRVHASIGAPVEKKFTEPGILAFGSALAGDAVPFGFGIDPRGSVTLRNWRFEGDALVVDAETSASIEVDYGFRKDTVLDIHRNDTIRIKLGVCYPIFDLEVLKLEACYNPPKQLCVKLNANVGVWSGTLTEYCVDVPI